MHGSFVKQLVKSKSGLRIIPADEGDVSPFLMKEPIWVPDKQASIQSIGLYGDRC